ncbi:hypothetical protein SDC9_94574 [bioreactor metagenome]|uniref:Uncharacterized protein n=1 Tax=bioreactor metagenome TaxID=1076179 RepID=A0A645AAK6_9ZZZZ
MEGRFQFERALLFGTKGLPFVFKDKVARPHFFDLAAGFVLHPHQFALGFKVKIHRPVIDPVRPLFGEHFALNHAVLVFAHFKDLAVFHHDLVGVFFQVGGDIIHAVLGVIHRKISKFNGYGVFNHKRFDLYIRHIVEYYLVLFDGAFIEHLARNVFKHQVNAFGSGFFLNIGGKAHFKFKGQYIHP